MYSTLQVYQENEKLREDNETLRREISQLNSSYHLLMKKIEGWGNEGMHGDFPGRDGVLDEEQQNRWAREQREVEMNEKGDESEDEDEVISSQIAEYREEIMRLEQEYELVSTKIHMQQQEIDKYKKTIQEKDKKIDKLESDLRNKEKKVDELKQGQETLTSSGISQQQNIRALEDRNKQLNKSVSDYEKTVRELNSKLQNAENKVITLKEDLAKEKAKDRECVFSSQTEGVELAQLRQTAKQLEKEVRQTRDFCLQEIEKEHKKTLTQSGLTEFMRLIGEVLQTGKVEEITDCPFCRMKHDQNQDQNQDQSECDGYRCLQKIANVVNNRNQMEEMRKQMESKMKLQEHLIIQKRGYVIVVLLSILIMIIIQLLKFFNFF